MWIVLFWKSTESTILQLIGFIEETNQLQVFLTCHHLQILPTFIFDLYKICCHLKNCSYLDNVCASPKEQVLSYVYLTIGEIQLSLNIEVVTVLYQES